jgi:hypothetical protein
MSVLTFSCVQQPVGPVDDDVNDGKIATEMSSTEINWELLTASVREPRLIRLTERNESRSDESANQSKPTKEKDSKRLSESFSVLFFKKQTQTTSLASKFSGCS